MGAPGAAQRNDPLALNHPVNTTQEIRAEMFEDWSLKPGSHDIANAFFRYRAASQATGRNIQMTYSYETLADQVSTADLAAYDTALRKVKDTLGYTFTYRTPAQVTAARQKDPDSGYGQFNWPIAVMLGGVMAVTIPLAIFCCWICRRASPRPPSLRHGSLEGLGGWLILVAFGLIVRPLILIHATVIIYPSIFHLETWRALTNAGQPAYHPLWMPVLLFELLFNSVGFIYCLLLLVLFFQKRWAWRYYFIAFFIFVIGGLAIDLCLGQQIPAVAAKLGSSVKALMQSVLGAAIWIPYALTSKRVRATFRY
jgi:hypothetical protein